VYLHVYRTLSAEYVRAGDEIELGDGKTLIIDEVRLTREGVKVGGLPPKTDSSRRSWVDFKYGEDVRLAAGPEDVRGVMDALHNALGFATAEWDDRNAPSDPDASAPAPPWKRFDNGPTIDVSINGHWFTIDPDEATEDSVPLLPDPDDDEDA
jgi:hypothetical protein